MSATQLIKKASADTTLSQEQVEDFAGAVVASGGTKTGITVTYQDGTGDMDFVVDDSTDLPLSGGTMTGTIDMDGSSVEGINRIYFNAHSRFINDMIDDDSFTSGVDAQAVASAESIKSYVNAENYHAYNGGSYWGTSSLRYIPFSGSTSEQTSRAYNRDYISQIIMPYDGNVMKLYLYNDYSSSSDPGSTDVTVWKNGSSGDSDTQALGYRTAVLFSLDENFSAGDRIQIAIDPSGTIRYLTHNLLVKFDA